MEHTCSPTLLWHGSHGINGPDRSFLLSCVLLILSLPADSMIAIGVCTMLAPDDQMPGWNSHSWGYHGDDGNIFHGSGSDVSHLSAYGNGDTVECCVDQSAGTISFTRMGRILVS